MSAGERNMGEKGSSSSRPLWLLACLSGSAVVQGMIFTNVVLSSIERRFGLQSTQSGIIAGAYDFGNLLAVIPVTYFGGRPGASKSKYIAVGLLVMGIGSLLFTMPHFMTDPYMDSFKKLDFQSSPSNEDARHLHKLCASSDNETMLTNELCGNRSPSWHEHLSKYQLVFIAAQLLHGIGAAALITLGTTLLDESVSKSDAPMLIGVFESSFVLGPALGYVIGGQLLNIFTEFYLISEENGNLVPNVDSPRWIGAWWIGSLIIVVLSIIFALLLALNDPEPHPSSASSTRTSNTTNSTTLTRSSSNNGASRSGFWQHLSHNMKFILDLPLALSSLLSNATFMFISLGAAMDGFLLAGMAAFLPKYFEAQFHLSPGPAATLVGLIVVPAGAGGTLLGGFIGKKFQLDRAGSLKLYILCQLVILPFYLGYLFYCPNASFQGLQSNFLANSSDKMSPDLYSSCNSDCGCSRADFEPICMAQTTFFSPCFAGCTTLVNNSLAQCSCNTQNGNVINEEEVLEANFGFCEDWKCDFWPFATTMFAHVFFTFAATMPGLVASLRAVRPEQKSLSLGLQTIIMRGLGTVPGPVVFGYLMDITCLLWREDECGQLGSCLIYDNAKMSIFIMLIMIIFRFGGTIFFAAALYCSKFSSVEDCSHEEDRDNNGDKSKHDNSNFEDSDESNNDDKKKDSYDISGNGVFGGYEVYDLDTEERGR